MKRNKSKVLTTTLIPSGMTRITYSDEVSVERGKGTLREREMNGRREVCEWEV
jgi:hypothetical protein